MRERERETQTRTHRHTATLATSAYATVRRVVRPKPKQQAASKKNAASSRNFQAAGEEYKMASPMLL